MKRLLVVFITTVLLSTIWLPKPVYASQQETNITTETTTEATTEQVEKKTTKKRKTRRLKLPLVQREIVP